MSGACPPSLAIALANAGGLGGCGALLVQPVPSDAGDVHLPDFEAPCEAIVAVAPKVISSIMRFYPPAFVVELKKCGIVWFATVTTVAEARASEKAGADVIVAQRI